MLGRVNAGAGKLSDLPGDHQETENPMKSNVDNIKQAKTLQRKYKNRES